MRKLLSLALFFLAVLIACVSWSRPAIANEEDRVIRIASPGNHAPFTMYDEATQEWSGFEIDLWRAIGEKSSREVHFIRLDIPAVFAELDLGRVDSIATQIGVTPTRREKYDFSQPFFFSPHALVVAEDNDEVKSWKDMEGKSIALSEGNAMNELLVASDPENKVKKSIYGAGSAIMQEVSIGRVTATPYPYLVLPYFLKKNPDLKLKAVDVENPVYTEVNAYPFDRTDRGRELLKLTDGILTRMFEDGSYAKLCEKWFGMNVMDSRYAKEYREKQGK